MGLKWVVYYCRICCFVGWMVSHRLDHISGFYSIGWIGLAGLDWIGLYRIVSAGSGYIGIYALAGYFQHGTDGLDGVLVGRGWDGRTLTPARTGAPPWALEQGNHHWFLRGGDTLAGYCQHGRDGTDGLDGVLVGRTDVSTRRNGSATMGDVTGASLLSLEGRRAM